MKGKLLVFGGTTEARELLASGIPALCSVATDYGARLAGDFDNVRTIVGRLDASGMAELIKKEGVTCVVDATHPYAAEVTENIGRACKEQNVPLLRVLRSASARPEGLSITEAASCEEAARLLGESGGNVLLTVGSKELDKFTALKGYQQRLFVRVLPLPEVVKRCAELGFDAGHVVAMQGPFSEEMNEALIRMTGASIVVTKDGGVAGGAREKFDAAVKTGASVILVKRPEDEGCSVAYAVRWARERLGLPAAPFFPLWVDLRGRKAVIAGGGAIALRRARTLKKCGAEVWVVSPVFRAEFSSEGCRLVERKWQAGDLEGAFIAVAATDDRAVNRDIGIRARRQGIHVSVADETSECTFLFPSFVCEGEAAVSVSTGGFSPKLVRRLADKLRDVWPAWVVKEKWLLENEEGEKC